MLMKQQKVSTDTVQQQENQCNMLLYFVDSASVAIIKEKHEQASLHISLSWEP